MSASRLLLTLSSFTLVCLLGASVRSEDKPAAAEKPKTSPELNTNTEKASYVVGFSIARNLKQSRMEGIDLKTLMRGLQEGLEGKQPALKQDEIQAVMQSFQAEMAKKREAEAADNLKKGEEFLAANKNKPDVKTTASGLQYKVIKSGTGATPKATDGVRTNYRGTFIDGKEFDSSKGDKPAAFKVNEVIPGWTEALQLMKVGDQWQLFVPAKLAYGPNGNPSIPPNSVLLFDIELLGID